MEALARVGGRITILIDTIVKRKNNCVGHVMRCNGPMQEAMKGRMLGKRGPGKPRVGMYYLEKKCTEQ